uniref:Uncharacterized LOC105925516 n=2 Tax=Fundulus heteroclitus TaxID=8078 RepID=A0A3Q2Q4A2_FUNHE
MSTTGQFVTLLAFVIVMAPDGKADRHLPAPTNLSYKWIDGFVVNVTWSWLKPEELPQNCSVKYEIWQMDKHVADVKDRHYFEDYYLTKDLAPSGGVLDIHCKAKTDCKGWSESEPAKAKISTNKRHDELVKDFTCLFLPNGFNCSWLPVNPSEKLKVSYRVSGKTKEDIQSLKVCENPYPMNGKCGCELHTDKDREIFVLVETKKRMNTFIAQYAISVPQMSVEESGSFLHLTWTSPNVGQKCTWRTCVWYKECGKEKFPKCFDIKTYERIPVTIPYNKCCRYEFQFNTTTDRHCTEVSSKTSDVITHGTTTPCLDTANVAAIVIPIIVCICVALSFYCFKKHEHIFGSTKLDHSVIKEMFNFNKLPRTRLYVPMEIIDPPAVPSSDHEKDDHQQSSRPQIPARQQD